MKVSAWQTFAFALVLLGVSAYAVSKGKHAPVLEPTKTGLPAASNLQSFEFLGCSGDWADEKLQPQAWRADKKGKTTFLIKHPADCGYSIATNPEARIVGSSIDFSYSMSNDDGALATCYCGYWATFELKSAPDKITKISINGEEARLMSGLSEQE